MSAPLVSTTISERVEGTRRILESDGWEWVIAPDEFGDDEPRIADTHLAQRLGLELKHLRDLSARYENAGHITPKVCRTVRGTPESHKNLGGRPGKARFYAEADALFLVTRSEASGAIALTKAMILVVVALRRHLAQTVPVEAHTRKLPGRKALPVPEVTSRLSAGETATLRAAAKRAGLSVEDFIDHAITMWIVDLAAHQRHPALAAKYREAGPIRTAFVALTEGLHEAVERKARAMFGNASPEARDFATYALVEMGAHMQNAHDLAAYSPKR